MLFHCIMATLERHINQHSCIHTYSTRTHSAAYCHNEVGSAFSHQRCRAGEITVCVCVFSWENERREINAYYHRDQQESDLFWMSKLPRQLATILGSKIRPPPPVICTCRPMKSSTFSNSFSSY